jgi:adenylate cyclase
LPILDRVWVRRFATRRFVFLCLTAMIVAPVYGVTAKPIASIEEAFFVAAQSLIYAFVIGVPLAAAETLAFVAGTARRQRLPFAAMFALKSVGYAAWIVAGVAIAGSFTHAHDEASWEDLLLHKGTLVAAGITAIAINIFLSAGRLIGLKTLLSVVSGRYRRPQREERLFAFVDVRGATTAAEQLGDLRFQAYLVELFRIIEMTALEAGGEVHDYIGDQAMLVWPATPASGSGPLHWIAHLSREIDARRSFFEADYGLVPDLRVGMHVGPVIVGEVGLFRTKLAYLGDAVNTAARVEELAEGYAACALITGQVHKRYPLPNDLKATSLGEWVLRGKQGSVNVFRLDLTAI